ncbi:hypothetical protein ACI2OX_09385 [Bacillus sp. N9]
MEQLILLAIFGLISMAFNAMKKPKQHQADQRKPVAQQAKPFVEPRKELVEHDIDLSKARNLREAAEMLLTKPEPIVEEIKKVDRKNIQKINVPEKARRLKMYFHQRSRLPVNDLLCNLNKMISLMASSWQKY